MTRMLYADDEIMKTITAEDVEYFEKCSPLDIEKISKMWWTTVKGCCFWQDDMENCYLANSEDSDVFNEVCEIL